MEVRFIGRGSLDLSPISIDCNCFAEQPKSLNTVGQWQYKVVDPLGLSSDDAFIRLQPGLKGTGSTTSLYISYRTECGCDSTIDPQFTGKLSVHSFDGDATLQQAQVPYTPPSTSPTFLLALIPPGTQWISSGMKKPGPNIIVYLVEELLGSATTGNITSSARVGVCRFIWDPSECNGRLTQKPTAVTSALPSDHCNHNGVCESVFGENSARCAADCQTYATV